MSMDKQCEIVQDLLPLYVDGACSESSAAIVKEHLETCPECKTLYEKLCSDTGEGTLKAEMVGVVAKREKKVKKKRLLTIVASVVLTIVLIFTVINLWPASIDYGSSEIYSREDMDDAIKLIKDQFYSWEGCKLYSIYYTDDSFCQREIEYVNTLADDGVTYTECIVFRTRFRSPIFGGGAWNANFEYDWSWYLARTDGGEWDLLTWGMP